MRHRATHLLHVLLSAPVAAVLAASAAPSVHVRAAVREPAPTATRAQAPPAAPHPFLVVLDAGHGGSPDNAHPETPYDSGAVSAQGLLEKDLALDIVTRVEPLLQAQGVEVVLTRRTDVAMDITSRMQVALDRGADLFISIHFNGFTDPAAAGSLVLYPKDFCQPFAQTMAQAMARRLGAHGVLPDGLQFRPEMFQQATMPAVTLEPLFLTNPTEAALIARPEVRATLAEAVVDGVDQQAGDQIAQRQALAAEWAVVARVLGAPAPAAPLPVVVAVPTPAVASGSTPVPAGIVQVPSPGPGSSRPPVGGAGHADPSAPATASPSASGAGSGATGTDGGTTGSGTGADVVVPAGGSGPSLPAIAAALVALVLLVLWRRPLLHVTARLAAAMMAAVARLEGVEVPAIARFDSRGRRRQARRRALLERSRTRTRTAADRLRVHDELFFRPRPRSARR